MIKIPKRHMFKLFREGLHFESKTAVSLKSHVMYLLNNESTVSQKVTFQHCAAVLNKIKLIPNDAELDKINICQLKLKGKARHIFYDLNGGAGDKAYGFSVTHSKEIMGQYNIEHNPDTITIFDKKIELPKSHDYRKSNFCSTLVDNSMLKILRSDQILWKIGVDSPYEQKRLLRHLITQDRVQKLIEHVENNCFNLRYQSQDDGDMILKSSELLVDDLGSDLWKTLISPVQTSSNLILNEEKAEALKILKGLNNLLSNTNLDIIELGNIEGFKDNVVIETPPISFFSSL